MQQYLLLILFIFCFISEGAVPSTSPSNNHNHNHHHHQQQKQQRTVHRIRRVVTSTIKNESIKTIFVDINTNYTLPCNGRLRNKYGVWRWVITLDNHDRTKAHQNQLDGSLFFPSLTQADSGIYSCELESLPDDENDSQQESGNSDIKKNSQIAKENLESIGSSSTNNNKNIISHSSFTNPAVLPSSSKYESQLGSLENTVRLKVRTPPLLMKNVTILPSTVLASVMWETGDDGGYPISSFQIRYRQQNESEEQWKTCQPDFISPDKRHLDIFHLLPNSEYIFEIWANNHLGKGYSTLIQVSTHNDLQEIEGKYLLEGVDNFDSRAWIVAVLVVLGTLLILGVATCFLFYKEYYIMSESRRSDLDGESIELMPNIILNPAYEFQSMELLEPDENLNDTTPLRVNNNSVIFPTRV